MGLWELIVIFILGLIFLGPSQLVQVAKVLGKALRFIQHMTTSAKTSLDKIFEEGSNDST